MARLAGDASRFGGLARSLDLWDDLIRLPWPKGSEFPAQLTERVAAMIAADPSRRRGPWLDRLSRAAAALAAHPGRYSHAAVVDAERSRVESQLGGRARLRQDLLDHVSVHVGQAAVDAVVAERQPRVIDAQEVKDGGVQVVAVRRRSRRPCTTIRRWRRGSRPP